MPALISHISLSSLNKLTVKKQGMEDEEELV